VHLSTYRLSPLAGLGIELPAIDLTEGGEGRGLRITAGATPTHDALNWGVGPRQSQSPDRSFCILGVRFRVCWLAG
jgi:hypothetical protein